MRDLYLKPVGLFSAVATSEGREPAHGSLRLAGGWLDFTHLEVIARRRPSGEQRVLSIADFCERDWGGATLPTAELFEALRAPRTPLRGRTLDRPRIMGIVNITPDS